MDWAETTARQDVGESYKSWDLVSYIGDFTVLLVIRWCHFMAIMISWKLLLITPGLPPHPRAIWSDIVRLDTVIWGSSHHHIPDSKVHGGLHGTHLGPTGPRWVPCRPHEPCYHGCYRQRWHLLPVQSCQVILDHDGVTKWKTLSRYWPLCREGSFDVFFDLRLNQQLSKQWRHWWFETPL